MFLYRIWESFIVKNIFLVQTNNIKIKHAKKIIDRNFLFLQELFPIQANNYNSAIVLISHVTKGHTAR